MWLVDCGVESENISQHLVIFTNTIAVSCKIFDKVPLKGKGFSLFFFLLSPSNEQIIYFFNLWKHQFTRKHSHMWNIHIYQYLKKSHMFLCLQWLCSKRLKWNSCPFFHLKIQTVWSEFGKVCQISERAGTQGYIWREHRYRFTALLYDRLGG